MLIRPQYKVHPTAGIRATFYSLTDFVFWIESVTYPLLVSNTKWISEVSSIKVQETAE